MSVAAASDSSNARVVAGRECGSCSLCCKVYDIEELSKPAGKWCSHCRPGKGCVIHDTLLPEQCEAFNCLWRIEAGIPAIWKPDQARMVLTVTPVTHYILVKVDPNAPTAWRKQPYYDQLRQWSKNNVSKGIYVVVLVNDDATLVLPDQEMPIGKLRHTDRLTVRRNIGPGAAGYEVTVTAGSASGAPVLP